ncbi:hypothetical protein SPD48_16165 [Pseudogracilibacillus sp. SE30717A]|uniref:hypothetical protein n=1 Tax=Pseudogracilibacillus sp. SE30717A TaxID=3098293 RepID=UPI00300E4A7E
MNINLQVYYYEIKQRQKHLNTVCSLDAGFDEKSLLKKIFSGKNIFYFKKRFKRT